MFDLKSIYLSIWKQINAAAKDLSECASVTTDSNSGMLLQEIQQFLENPWSSAENTGTLRHT